MHQIIIEKEQYYTVDYVDHFYIGCIVSKDNPNTCTMKFLHQMSVGGKLQFTWPKTDDIASVDVGNIFYGPVIIEGCGEFKIPNLKAIQKEFSSLYQTK